MIIVYTIRLGKKEGTVIIPSEYYANDMHFYLEHRNDDTIRLTYIKSNYTNVGFGIMKQLSASFSYENNCRITVQAYNFDNKKVLTFNCREYNIETNTFGSVFTADIVRR